LFVVGSGTASFWEKSGLEVICLTREELGGDLGSVFFQRHAADIDGKLVSLWDHVPKVIDEPVLGMSGVRHRVQTNTRRVDGFGIDECEASWLEGSSRS
jgi:hypothetical protein